MILYPNNIKPYDAFEYHPCHTHFLGEKEIVEQCMSEEADFWSVYIHLKQGGLSCIADLCTEQDCVDFISLLTKMNYLQHES